MKRYMAGEISANDYVDIMRPVGSTISHTDLPVSQKARELIALLIPFPAHDPYGQRVVIEKALDILAAADPKDVQNLLWARRAGKL